MTRMTVSAGPPVGDGRSARAQRTRAAIVDTHIDLLRSGNLRPTAEQIAREAGVSVRSLWVHFPDVEALLAATAVEVLARQDRDLRPVPPDLPLDERVEEFCRQRATALEHITPLARASAAREPFSAALRDYHRRHVERVRDEVRTLFAAELVNLRATDRDRLAHALTAATTWGAWATLRDDLGLGPQRSRAVLVRTVRALLTDVGRPADPTRGAPT